MDVNNRSKQKSYDGLLRLKLMLGSDTVPVSNFDEIRGILERCDPNLAFSLSLEAVSNTSSQFPKFERWFYKLFGVPLPDDARRISVHGKGGAALVCYEQDDREYLLKRTGKVQDGSVQMLSEAGEPFLVSRCDCVSLEEALSIAAEFAERRSRPKAVMWRVSK